MIYYYLSPFVYGLVEPINNEDAKIILPPYADQTIGAIWDLALKIMTFKPIGLASPPRKRELIIATFLWNV